MIFRQEKLDETEEDSFENSLIVEESESTLPKANSEPPQLKNDVVTLPQKINPKILINRGKSCDQEGKILTQPFENVLKTPKNEIKPSPTKEQLPSVVAGRHRENLAFYTPRARRSILNDETVQKEIIHDSRFLFIKKSY